MKADRRSILKIVKTKRVRTKEVLMQFTKTQTYQNLARSFAGECQAGMRYQFIAELAMQEKYKTLSDEIKTIAKNETVHAKRFYDTLIQKAGNQKNIIIETGYPFHSGTLEDGLKAAMTDEKSESTEIYPKYAEIAKQEGFKDVADLYTLIGEVENQHNVIFDYLYHAVKNGTLYKAESPILWICSECGHMHVGKEAWKVCPLCSSEQGYVDLHLPFEGVRI